jgi:putative transposase
MVLLKKEDEFSWLKEINAQSLQSSLKNLDTAYKNFFRRLKKSQDKEKGFPKFASRHKKQTFHAVQRVKIEDGKLSMPKFREGIKIKLSRKPEGKIKGATISKTPTGKYYASLLCETTYYPLDKTGNQVGIDTGIKDLAILSDGETYKNLKPLKSAMKKLRYESRQLSKKKKGSNSRNKQRHKLAKAHEKISSIRQDYLHKVSTEIVKNNDLIAVEDLAIKNMVKNHSLAQALTDASLGEFYRLLEYKSEWNDREFIRIDRFYPSSKTCSSCGWIKKDLKLKHREWTCESCNETHDRDFNAAKNILQEGVKKLAQ